MSEITNLKRFRKERDAALKRAQADANAVKFGRGKAQKVLDAARAEQARRKLDQHRIEDDEA